MKTFLVNLDKNTERLVFMTQQFERFGLTFERLRGVYGKALSHAEMRRCYSPVRAVLAMGRTLAPGEIGCSLSHRLVYQRMVDDQMPVALVVEDDIAINGAFKELVERLSQMLDAEDPKVVLLTALGNPQSEDLSEFSIQQIPGGLCTDAYVVTLAAAKALLRANYPVFVTADRWRRFSNTVGVQMCRAFPTTVWQDKERFPVSEILQTHKRYFGIMWVLWKVSRIIETILDKILIAITGR